MEIHELAPLAKSGPDDTHEQYEKYGQSGQNQQCQALFEGFAKVGLTGSDLADLSGVTPPTVSKWRRGIIQIPPSRIAFFTLVLGHLIEDLRQLRNLDTSLNASRSEWGKRVEIIEEVAGGLLKVQEQLNMEIDPCEVRLGAQMFREWWDSGASANLQKIWLRAVGESRPHEPVGRLIQEMDI